MGSTFKNQFWTRIKLEMKLRADATTQTVYFINQPMKGQWIENYFPILLAVGELGVEAGTYIPTATTGSFIIDDTIGSYGFQRKFSDILQRYEAIGAKVTLSFGKSIVADTTPTLSFSDEWVGYVQDIQSAVTNDDAQLTFNVSPQPFVDRVITRTITAADFPTAPDGSIGKAIPLAFGEISEVVPVSIGEFTTGAACFAYATEMDGLWEYDDLAVGDYDGENASYFVADDDGDYGPIYAEPMGPFRFSEYPASGTSQISLNANPELIQIIEPTSPYTTGTNFIIQGGEVCFYGNGSGVRVSGMKVEVALWRISLDSGGSPDLPVEKIATTELSMVDYDAYNNVPGTTWFVEFSFPEARVLNFNKWAYGFGYTASGFAAGDAGLLRNNSSTTYWTRDTASGNASGFKHIKTVGANYNVIRSAFQDAVIDTAGVTITGEEAGLVVRYFKIDRSVTTVNYENLKFIVRPIRNTSVEPMQTLLSYLAYTYNGSSWADGSKWDTSTLSSQYSAIFASSGRYARQLHGATQGETTILQFTEEIAKNSISRVGQNNSGQWFLWPWGPTYTSAYKIPQEDISVLSISIGSVDTVINRALVKYGYTFQGSRFDKGLGQNTFDNYLYNLDAADDAILSLLGNGRTIYGLREAAETELPYIYDATSARAYIDFLCITGREPIVTAEIVIPYEKYRTLKMFDVIEVTHPAFPAYFGASPDHSPITYKGTGSGDTDEVTGGKQGFTYWRAQTYRAQIESRFIKAGFDAPPLIRLVIRLIINKDDPT